MRNIRTLELRASDLWSKNGFGDGDAIDEFLSDEFEIDGVVDYRPMPPEHREAWGEDAMDRLDELVLYDLVEHHLVPLFPEPIEIHTRVNRAHNPIRAATYFGRLDGEPEWAKSIVVKLTRIDVVASLHRVMNDVGTVADSNGTA